MTLRPSRISSSSERCVAETTHAHIDRHGPRRADRQHFAFRQHAQETGLRAACRRFHRETACRRRVPESDRACPSRPRRKSYSADVRTIRLSISVSGIAAPFTATNGAARSRGAALSRKFLAAAGFTVHEQIDRQIDQFRREHFVRAPVMVDDAPAFVERDQIFGIDIDEFRRSVELENPVLPMHAQEIRVLDVPRVDAHELQREILAVARLRRHER